MCGAAASFIGQLQRPHCFLHTALPLLDAAAPLLLESHCALTLHSHILDFRFEYIAVFPLLDAASGAHCISAFGSRTAPTLPFVHCAFADTVCCKNFHSGMLPLVHAVFFSYLPYFRFCLHGSVSASGRCSISAFGTLQHLFLCECCSHCAFGVLWHFHSFIACAFPSCEVSSRKTSTHVPHVCRTFMRVPLADVIFQPASLHSTVSAYYLSLLPRFPRKQAHFEVPYSIIPREQGCSRNPRFRSSGSRMPIISFYGPIFCFCPARRKYSVPFRFAKPSTTLGTLVPVIKAFPNWTPHSDLDKPPCPFLTNPIFGRSVSVQHRLWTLS